jgi:hypothetical protein
MARLQGWRAWVVVGVATMCAGAMASAQTTGWKTFSYPADGFSASFPGEPEIEKETIPVGTASFESRTYGFGLGEAYVGVVVIDYGKAAEGLDPDALLQAGKQGSLEESHSHLVREKKITLGEYPGLEFEDENDKYHATARAYLDGGTLYTVLVAYPNGHPYEHTAEFLDSFRVIPRTDKGQSGK